MRTLILSMYDNEQFLFEALKAGASGYVLKSGADRDIVEASRAAMRGETFLYPSVVSALVRDYVRRDGKHEGFDPLTPREQEVVKLIAEAAPVQDDRQDALHQPHTPPGRVERGSGRFGAKARPGVVPAPLRRDAARNSERT